MKPSLLSPIFTAGLSFSSVILAQETGHINQQADENAPKPKVTEDHVDTTTTPAGDIDDNIYVGTQEFNIGLTKNLATKLSGKNAFEIKQLSKDPKIARSLAVWKITSLCPTEDIAEIASSEEGLNFLAHFLRDTDWMEGFLNSGPIVNPDRAFKYLAKIFATSAEDIIAKPVYKKLATATALEFARKGYPEDLVLTRYKYFHDSHKEDKLNPVFDELDYWDMRILAGCVPTGWGSVESLTWQRDNVRVPARDYTGAAWHVPYRLENFFGDSVHSSDYYATFGDSYDNQALMSREVGAVCGGISHYGTYAAVANGVPAVTMGEPGHCAFAVRVTKDKWEAANSVSTKRSTHWNFYGTPWSFLQYTQTIQSQLQPYNDAYRAKRAGDVLADAGDHDGARAAYITALSLHPQNYQLWSDYLDWEKQVDEMGAEEWQKVNQSIVNHLAAEYPEVCAKLLNEKVYLPLLSKMKDANIRDKIGQIMLYHKAAQKMGEVPWPMDAVINAQAKTLCSTLGKEQLDYPDLQYFMEKLMECHLGTSEFGGPALAWCQQQVADDPDKQQKFFDTVTRMLARPGMVGLDALTMLANQIMINAQKNGDMDTFQIVGKLMKKQFKPSLPKVRKPSGELLSRGGFVSFDSYRPEFEENRWQAWGILEECGGMTVCGKDAKNPYALVKLPCMGVINGITVICEPVEEGGKPAALEIEVSANGIDWEPFGKVDEMLDINIVNMKNTPKSAQQIRVKCICEKITWTVKAILVTGRRTS